MIKVKCGCGRDFNVDEKHAGKRLACGFCSRELLIPSAATTSGAVTTIAPAIAGNTPSNRDPTTKKSKKQFAKTRSGKPRLPQARPLEDGAPLPAPADDFQGRSIGTKYDVLEKIGEGGMGAAVWVGYDRALDQKRAIKILPAAAVKEEMHLERFIREARLAARLNHTNVATVYDVDVDRGHAFIVMELVDGESLDSYVLNNGSMPWREAAKAVCDAAKGLAAAHEIGLIHRDVKPANLLRTNSGVIKVVDFGLAKIQADATRFTQKGVLLGTPAYMSPEQWQNERVDHRTDLYSLICSFYFLLTGKHPFEAPSPLALGYQHRYEPFPDPRKHVAGLPDSVCRILARGAEKDTGNRIQTAEELIAALEAAIDTPAQSHTFGSPWPTDQSENQHTPEVQIASGSASAPQVKIGSPYQRLRRLRGRKPPLSNYAVAAGAAAMVLLLGVVLFVLTNNGKLRIELNDPDAEVTVEIDGRVQIKSSALDEPIRLRAGEHDIVIEGRGYDTITDKVVIQRGKEWLLRAELVPKSSPPGRVADATAPMAAPASAPPAGDEVPQVNTEEWSVQAHTGPVRSVAFSPDGRWAVSGGEDSFVRLWDVETGNEIKTFRGHTSWVWSVAFTSDGKTIVSGGADKTCRFWNAETGVQTSQVVDASANRAAFRALAPDLGLAAAFRGDQGRDNGITIWDVANEEKLATFPTGFQVWSAAFSPDGRDLIYSGGTSDVHLRGVRDPQRVARLKQRGGIAALAFSNDATRAVSGSWLSQIVVWDVPNRQAIHTLTGHTSHVDAVAISPDGSRAVSGSDDTSVKLWDLDSGQEILTWHGHKASLRAVAISADGLHALSGDATGNVRLWSAPLAPGQPQRKDERSEIPQSTVTPAKELGVQARRPTVVHEEVRFEGHLGDITDAVFSADGQFILSCDTFGSVRLWDVEKQSQIGSLEGDFSNDQISGVSFSPDGQHALTSGGDGTVRLWDLKTKKEIRRLPGHKSTARDVVFAPDGVHALSSSDGFGGEPNLICWNVASGSIERPLRGHNSPVFPVAISSDGKFALSGSYGKNVYLWNIQTGQIEKSFDGHNGPIRNVGFSADGTRIFSASGWGALSEWKVHVWDRKTGDSLFARERSNAAALAPDGKTVLVNEYGATVIYLVQVADGRELCRFEGHTKDVGVLAFSPNGQSILSAGPDKTVRFWRVPTVSSAPSVAPGASEDELSLGGAALEHLNSVKSVAFNPDGSLLASGGEDGAVKLWDARTGRHVATFPHRQTVDGGVVFTPDGTRVASWSETRREPWRVKFWDITTERETPPNQVVGPVAFSPNQTMMVAASDIKKVLLLEYPSGRAIDSFDVTDTVHSVAYSHDGKLIAAGMEDASIRIWSTESRQLLHTLRCRTNGPFKMIQTLEFSPDDTALASGGLDVALWDTSSGEQKWAERKHIWAASCLAFSHDGRMLVSVGGEGEAIHVQITEVASGKTVHSIRGYSGAWKAAFAPDDSLLVTAGPDHRLRVWETETWTERALLEEE